MSLGTYSISDLINNSNKSDVFAKDNVSDYTGIKGTTLESEVNDDVKVIDSDWINSRFIVPDSDLDPLDAANRFYTTADNKFTDSTLGGNIGINPRPQFTRYADIKGGSRLTRSPVTISNTGGNIGTGRYHSEALDDNAQTIFMEFGLPKFNSGLDFFTRAIDYEDSYIANHGRVPVGYKIGKFLGGGLMLAAFPLITLTIWTVKLASKLFLGHGSFDYYYLEPTMHMYWGTVSTIVTQLATEMGILAPEMSDDPKLANKIGMPTRINQDDLAAMRELLPGLISENNYIDIFAIANKAQVRANKQLLEERKLYEKGDINEFDFLGYVKKENSTAEYKSAGSGSINANNKALSFTNFLDKVTKGNGLFAGVEKESKTTPITKETKVDKFEKDSEGRYDIADTEERKSYLDKVAENIDASIKEGGMHATFYVDYTGSVTESFSNSVSEIDTAGKINSVAGAARNMKFNLVGGNLLGDTVGQIIDAGKNVVAGTLDSVSYGLSGVLQTITGGGYVDIPKKWDSSDMQLPTITYNMQLISPYGNVVSQLTNIYIPLAMILAGTLPLAAGKSSHTSPFICSVFNKGIQQIKLGMVTSLSISRGTSNLGFNKRKRPLAIDVSFTVTDFSTLLTAPVNSSIFDFFNVSLDDDTPLSRYLATLGSRDLLTSKYMMPKVKLRASRLLMKKDQMLSPASMGMRVGVMLNDVLGGLVADHSLTLSQMNK